MKISNILLLSVFAATLAAQGDASLQAAIKEVDALATDELARHPIGGCTVGIVVGSELVWAKSYGLADIEGEISASNEHLYRIGSITKQFTGLMLLQLEERGMVHLTDSVIEHFPELADIGDRPKHSPPITFLQLATMTAGLSREPRNLHQHLQGAVEEWEDVMIAAMPDVRYEFEPGTHYQYSNIGYAILGATLGRVAEASFVDFQLEEIFAPLHMIDTVFEPNDRVSGRIAKGYELRDGKPDGNQPAREHAGRGYKVPNGAIYTTVADLACFLSFELGHGPESVLSKKARLANYGRVVMANGNLDFGYGVGFMIRRYGERLVIGHGGGVPGYSAAAWVEPAKQVGVIVLRNVGGGRFRTDNLCQVALRAIAMSRQN